MGKHNVFVYGAFPPPVHGLANVNAALLSFLRGAGVNAKPIDVARPKSRFGFLYRIMRSVQSMLMAATTPKHSTMVLALSSGSGLIFDCLFALICIFKRHRLALYFHNFSLVDQRRIFLSTIVSNLRTADQLIFLCDEMSERFTKQYGAHTTPHLLVSNLCWLPEPTPSKWKPACFPTIGFLGQLSPEKGYLDFSRIAQSLKNHDISFVSAGPVTHLGSAAIPNNIKCFGPLYGTQKDDFLQAVDILIFPSKYKHEAQPLVIFEALRAGCVVLSYRIGCTCEIEAWSTGHLTSSDQLEQDLLDIIESIRNAKLNSTDVRQLNVAEFASRQRLALAGRRELLNWVNLVQ